MTGGESGGRDLPINRIVFKEVMFEPRPESGEEETSGNKKAP